MAREEIFLNEFSTLVTKEKALLIEELWDCPKALLAAHAHKKTGKKIVIITGGERESRLYDDFAYFHVGKIVEFPAWEALPGEEIPPSPDIVGERYEILQKLGETTIILTSLQAALGKLLPKEELAGLYLPLQVGKTLPFATLPDRLCAMGYHRYPVAGDKGEFALRGGVIDIFPVSSPDPVRIEFWDEEIVSIRTYDPLAQVSTGKIESILITPAQELPFLEKKERLYTLFDYLGEETIVFFDDLAALEDKYISLKSMMERKYRTFCTMEELLENIAPLQKIYCTSSPIEELCSVKILPKSGSLSFDFFGKELIAKRWRHPFFSLFPTLCPPEMELESFTPDLFLKTLKKTKLSIHFLTETQSEENKLKEWAKGITACYDRGYLSSGFLLDTHHALIPFTELTHHYKVRREKQRSHYHSLPVEMFAISPGETVVYEKSGIGKYAGIEKKPNNLGIETEYLVLEYAEGAKLYVPIEQSNLVSKYIGATEEIPKLHTLGSNRWKLTKERTQRTIMGYAQDLLEMEAERVLREGFSYPPDSDLMHQFSADFPYVETPDQKMAIAKVSEDMQSSRPMDRLICGDVGYGKTEIAMRAAFKATVDGGKQVALLVPTTLLAMQHFDTFTQRMANYPLNIGLLSRFRTPKQNKETVEKLASGTIDIVIGTHRLISKDVLFKDLGLVIIDEEQRFGVRAKEHLKKLRKEVDCLTLSATPIPRTLYMSLIGTRDMSLINTPPEDRLPIQTILCTASDQIIKNALLRELARDGQAYVIHNRVETIFSMAERIRKLIPEVKLLTAHGQMSAEELDAIFHAFTKGEVDVLLSTSIIENGIDIPRANTIIVDRADRFGLADLYQMRGRVGRWNKKAYCYFLVPSTQRLSELARRRLSALTSITGYGGGAKVAMRDLEIRGAGNILGTEQSGQVESIGFHLYCKLLKKTISALKREEKPEFYTDVKMEFPFAAHLPHDYIEENSLRMEIYHRLGDAGSEEEIDSLYAEIRDRFGPPPPPVKWLYHLSRIRLFAVRNQFIHIKFITGVLHAEQSHGKKGKLTKKMLFAQPKNPEELEKRVISSLKEQFPCKT